MNCSKLFVVAKSVQSLSKVSAIRRTQLISKDMKHFSVSANLSKESNDKSLDMKDTLHRIIREYVEPSSPLKPFIERWFSKPWIKYSGETMKEIPIKERKETTSLKDGMFRIGFDLPGFKPEDIRIISSDNKLYIEAKKEESTKDGSKSWREFSFECNVDQNFDPNTVFGYLDSEGLLVIEGEVPKETLTGVKKPKPTKTEV